VSRPIPGLLRRAGVVALAATLPVTACSATSTMRPVSASAGGGWHGTVLAEPLAKPTATFTTTEGGAYRIDRDTKGGVVLLTFGYTHCPKVCGQVLTSVTDAWSALDPATRGRVRLLFVTVDPDRDTPAVLRSWLDRFDPAVVGLRAPVAEVRTVARALGVPVAGTDWARTTPSGGYTVAHGAQVLAFGPDGRARLMWLPGTPVTDLHADLVRLASTP
jgi:protein SCO1/2